LAFFDEAKALEAVISDAISSGVIIVASTAGEGFNKLGAWPADYPLVIKIAAATDFGKEAPETVKKKADFLFPGEDIVAQASFLGTNRWSHEVSGPSAATAVAAGIASLILTCDRMALGAMRDVELSEALKQHNKLKRSRVLKAFKHGWDEDAKYVRPWEFFSEGSNVSWGEGDSVLRWMFDKYQQLDVPNR
jgi:hypothetical protein